MTASCSGVEDIDPALDFYREVMGLVPRWREGNMAGLDFPRTPGTELVLHTDSDIPGSQSAAV